jgi:hypothetical protein
MARKGPVARIAFAAAFLALMLALVPVALAKGKPGGGGGGGTTSGGMALTGAVSASTYTVTGSGFKSGQFVALSIGAANGCCNATNVMADSTGHFTYTGWLVGPGTYFVDASVQSGRGWQVVAHWSTSVS